jgi:hypothetical protein
VVIAQKYHFMCPITGTEVVSDTTDLPDRWGKVAGDVYSPEGLGIIANRILTHPDADYVTITTVPYPDAVLDAAPAPPA